MRPVISGIIISIDSTSGRRRRHNSIASLPSAASPTSSRSGSAWTISASRLRTVSESSAMTTFMRDISYSVRRRIMASNSP
jgi:hypothetical protein